MTDQPQERKLSAVSGAASEGSAAGDAAATAKPDKRSRKEMFRKNIYPYKEMRQRADELQVRMIRDMERRAGGWRERVRTLDAQVRSLSPLAVLGRGYSVTTTAGGALLRSAAQVRPGERVPADAGASSTL